MAYVPLAAVRTLGKAVLQVNQTLLQVAAYLHAVQSGRCTW